MRRPVDEIGDRPRPRRGQPMREDSKAVLDEARCVVAPTE